MPRIFVSYRRADSATITDRIYAHLVRAFGLKNIFRDIDAIPAGTDFRQAIGNAITSCDVMLVILGPSWSNIPDEYGDRRLDNPNDFVRIEVETGLRLSQQMRVIPVLVNGATMPKEPELTPTLRELCYRNALAVRNDPDFEQDIERLVRQIRKPGVRRQNLRFIDRKWIGLTTGVLSLLVSLCVCVAAYWALIPEDKHWPFSKEQKPPSTPIYTSTYTIISTANGISAITPTETLSATGTPTNISIHTSTPTVTPTKTENFTCTPTNTHTISPMPSKTPSPTVSPVFEPTTTFVPTFTLTSVLQAYPCGATIIFRSAALLNVVRASPSSGAPLREPIQQGISILVLAKVKETRDNFWYQINDLNGNYLGWIPTEYVVPSDNCPE